MAFLCHFMGLKLQIQKNEKNGLEILANYTCIPNFKKIGPSVWSLAMRTDTHTHSHTLTHTHIWTDIFSKPPFLDSGDLKTDISTKISKSNFFTITILSPYILCMGESKNEWQSAHMYVCMDLCVSCIHF